MGMSFTTRSIAIDFIATATLLLLIAGPAARAQTGSGAAGSSGAANQSGSVREAPIGHRQPRPNQVPSEKNLSNPNDPLNKENAALDRKIKSICRGC
ncbi:MAG TPA: hypothetical protein VKB08_05120 [Bradyrhizobium sp.]|jgi:hypothetical protein|nr:hypothetical protein [Bradyrhizobium sp.]